MAAVERCEPDLIVLDVMLPGFDGLEVLRRVRATRSTPVLMLTARSTELDKVLGLELGADDYLTKLFSMRVRDTGVGIAPESLPHIFDRFYQGESTRESDGAGLGLSIVKQLVEIQGGTVAAESAPGEGTTIAFTLEMAAATTRGAASAATTAEHV